MFGFEYKKDYEASVKELSAIELIICSINDDLDDYRNGRADVDHVIKDLLQLTNWSLMNENVSDVRAVRLTRLISEISMILKEDSKLKEDTTE